MNFLTPKSFYIPLFFISSFPLIFILGKGLTNTFSVIIALYGIYLIIIKNYKFINNIFFKFYIFYLFILLVSSIFSNNILNSLFVSIPYFLFLFFIISHIFILKKFEKDYFKNFLFFSYLSFLLVIVFAVYEFFFSIDKNDELITYYTRVNGLKSLFSNKILGIYIQKFLPIFLGILLYSKNKLTKFDYLMILSLIILTFLSFSRTSIILLIIFFVLFYISFSEIRMQLKKFFLVSFIFIFSILPFTDFQQQIKKTFRQLSSESSFNLYPNHYLGHYNTALKIIYDKPFLGTGPDTFKELCSKENYRYFYDKKFYEDLNQIVYIDSCSTHPHHYYIQIFAESGLFAFLLLCIFYLFVIREFIKLFIINNSLSRNPLYKISIITILCNFFPLAPTTDFYNTQINALIYLPIIFFIYFKYIKKYI